MENDLIRRSDAENIFRRARRAMKPENYSGQEFFIRDNILLNAEQIVHSIPAVDAVEVCRCGDCKYKDDGIDEDGYPFLKCLHGRSYGGTRINDYCAWGKRREDGDT